MDFLLGWKGVLIQRSVAIVPGGKAPNGNSIHYIYIILNNPSVWGVEATQLNSTLKGSR